MIHNFWQGKNIRLRPLEQEDVDEILSSREEIDSEIDRSEDVIGFPLSRTKERKQTEELMEQLGKDDFYFWIIEDLEGQKVGYINSFDLERRHGTFKYAIIIKRPFWGKGYAREAIKIIFRYYFRELRYQKVNATVYSFNERSIRLHQKLGFVLEGRLRRTVYTNGQFFDTLYFGMTSEEFDALDVKLELPGSSLRMKEIEK
jgi:RimJ/RimL family protein N-acetyltransferase